MRKLNLEQGTPLWHNWRKTILSATDAGIIMGVNPWTTPYKLWQRKLGLVPEQETNDAMRRGSAMEASARSAFIEEYNIHMAPCCVESEEYNFLGASLDGISTCGRYILEVKCGVKSHTEIKQGIIAEYYKSQVQHQLLVTGTSKCYFYSFDGQEGICIEVLPDPTWIENYLTKAREFWKGIVFFEAPPLTHRDYFDKTDSSKWRHLAEQYKQVIQDIKTAEDRKDYLRKKLIEICGEENCTGNGIKVLRKMSKGRVVYEDIPELKAVDLDQYRKEAQTSWTILIDR